MKKVTFKITSGQNTLVECHDINFALASFKGIISEFGNGDGFIITLIKETIDVPDPKPVVNDAKEPVYHSEKDCCVKKENVSKK